MKHLVHQMPNYYTCEREGPELHHIVERFDKAARKTRECAMCGEWHPPLELKDAQKLDWSTGEWNDKEICLDCARLMGSQSDWRVW